MLRERIKTGNWLTQRRLRDYPLIILGVAALLLVVSVLGASGLRDGVGGQPFGTDFLSFWAASSLLWDGHAAAAYDHTALHAVQMTIAGPDVPLYTWLYPPPAFLVVAPLAALPYMPMLLVWLTTTLAANLSALRHLLPDHRAILPVLAFPPVLITIGHGQNAFLSAALLGWGLILLPRRPLLAGAITGLLIYKPHLGILLPVAFLAAGNWRAIVGAALSSVGMIVLSAILLGPEVWTAFLAKSAFAREVLEQGFVPWSKMIGTFAASRLLGASVAVAWGLQAIVTVGTAAVVWIIWRRPGAYPLKVAALATGTLLATPFALDYDATLLGLALAALIADAVRSGFRDWEISSLAVIWLLPLLWRPVATGTDVSLAPVTLLGLLTVVALRAFRPASPVQKRQSESSAA